MHVATSLDDLTVDVEADDAMERALRLWRGHGVVLFRNVLDKPTLDALRRSVREAQVP